jgi:Reverse transcriptase (RNA-dependent DNA polymerase)
MELLLGNMNDTQRSDNVCTVQQRIAELARERPLECFTALNHYLTVDWLKVAYERVNPKSAPGVDGQSWEEYGKNLEESLPDLLDRVKSGRYVAPPVKRAYIPKGDGDRRGIGMPTIENKVLGLIDQWLAAGVWEKGQLSYPEDGTPQGGVISPMLSNIYLHEELDCWFVEEVWPRMKGHVFWVRFADDFILGFQKKEDAEKVHRVLFKRFEKYGLSLHPENQASGSPGPQTQRSLWVLRSDGQLRGFETVSMGGDQGLAEMAGAPGRPERDALGTHAQTAGLLLHSRSPGGSLNLRSESMIPKNRMRESCSYGSVGCRRVTGGPTRK